MTYQALRVIIIIEMNDFVYKECTNISMKFNVYGILESDAEKFGYIKNGRANLCGFLNRLIPELSAYRDDLHEQFLQFNNGDYNITAAVENSLYQVYTHTLFLNDDSKVNMPFRISQKFISEFMLIQSEKLQKYRLDFTNYVRSLLEEYAIKPLYSREIFFHYRDTQILKKCIRKEQLCQIYSNEGCVEMVPIVIEPFVNLGVNYVFGLDFFKERFMHFRVKDLQRVVPTDDTITLREVDYTAFFDLMETFLIRED